MKLPSSRFVHVYPGKVNTCNVYVIRTEKNKYSLTQGVGLPQAQKSNGKRWS